MNKISLLDVLAAPQPRAAHAIPFQDMSEATFDNLTALARGFLDDA